LKSVLFSNARYVFCLEFRILAIWLLRTRLTRSLRNDDSLSFFVVQQRFLINKHSKHSISDNTRRVIMHTSWNNFSCCGNVQYFIFKANIRYFIFFIVQHKTCTYMCIERKVTRTGVKFFPNIILSHIVFLPIIVILSKISNVAQMILVDTCDVDRFLLFFCTFLIVLFISTCLVTYTSDVKQNV